MFKKGEKSEETVMYLESVPDLDEVLKVYEHTVEKVEERKANKKKNIVVFCALIIFLFGVMIALTIIFGKNISAVVVKNIDESFSVCSKNSFKILQKITEYKVDYNKNIFVFRSDNGNLFYLDLDNCKSNNDIKLVSEKVENDFCVLNKDIIIFKANGSLFCYYISDKTTQKICEKINGYFLCENGKSIYYLTNDKKLFVFDLNESKEILSDVDEIKCCKNSQKLNLIITQKNKLFFADENGLLTKLSDNFSSYFCSDENGIFENIYFLEESSRKNIDNIIFEDKLKNADASMVKPSSSDYKKSFAFGLIKYIDPAQYKQAYIKYQEKVLRDKIREFAENYKNSGEFYNLFCFDRKNISLIKENIKSDEVLSFSSSEKPFVFYRNIFSEKITLDISELQKEILNSTTQDEFNKIILKKFEEKNSVNCEILSNDLSIKFNIASIKDFDKIIFSKQCNLIILKKGNTFSLYKINENDVEKLMENEKNSCFILNDKYMFYIQDDSLYSIDLTSCVKNKISENINEIFLQSENVIVSRKITETQNNYYILQNGQISLLCANASDIIYINDNRFSYISDGNLHSKIDSKEYVNENVVSIIK